MRRRRKSIGVEDDAEVAMSPLIDCVFLLLIFFLVTTIIKRKEKQIRVEMPDTTAAIKVQTSDDILLIGIDKNGNKLKTVGKDRLGKPRWEVIKNLSAYLKEQISKHGTVILNKPLQIDADREVEFQKAIDVLDVCKIMGFSKVSIKIKQERR